MGLKTTYYLRTLAATQIEKSTLDAAKFGFTQKREYGAMSPAPPPSATAELQPLRIATTPPTLPSGEAPSTSPEEPKLCRLDDPDCEACQ